MGLYVQLSLSNHSSDFCSLDILREGLYHLPRVLYFIGVMSCFGVTVTLSILSDVLCLFTAHIYVGYAISASVYHYQLNAAGSLWNLFRGKLGFFGSNCC